MVRGSPGCVITVDPAVAWLNAASSGVESWSDVPVEPGKYPLPWEGLGQPFCFYEHKEIKEKKKQHEVIQCSTAQKHLEA